MTSLYRHTGIRQTPGSGFVQVGSGARTEDSEPRTENGCCRIQDGPTGRTVEPCWMRQSAPAVGRFYAASAFGATGAPTTGWTAGTTTGTTAAGRAAPAEPDDAWMRLTPRHSDSNRSLRSNRGITSAPMMRSAAR